MKKILLLIIALISAVHLCSQKYSIQDDEVLLIMESNSSKNDSLVNQLLADSLLKNCKSMVIGGKFKTIPPDLYRIDWIEDLQINNNDTVFLDINFSRFNKLGGILIFGGYLNIDNRVNLQNLTYFELVGVKFINGKFPEAVCNWLNLTNIIIREGNLKEISKNICKLHNLDVLRLSDNNIRLLPDELFQLEKLQILSLCGNKLKNISYKICGMKSLRYVLLDEYFKLNDRVENCLGSRIVRFDKNGAPINEPL
jgi:hypothetical protein